MDHSTRMQTNDARRWEAIDTFYLPQRAPLIVQTQDALYDAAADHLKRETPITYLEYGVASATSMRAMAARFGAPTSSFIGFDSFEGLPRPWLMHERGAFSTGGVLPYFGDPRVEFVRGWFQNTVPDRLKRLGQPANTTLVHYDCDLYSSTLFLLSTMWHYIPAYYFLMDDFIHEDATALYDFPRSYPVEIQFFAERSGGGGHPNQVFGHIRRVPFVLPD